MASRLAGQERLCQDMWHNPNCILTILDACCHANKFPMLDNGYVYLAASRLSLHRSPTDWALVIEVFGFSPRVGSPFLDVSTFASRLHARNTPAQYISQDAYERYLAHNPHNESRFFFPMNDAWQDSESSRELVAIDATRVQLRGHSITLPSWDAYDQYDIELEQSPRVQVFELCRFLAATQREAVLATPSERRVSVLPEMREILVLDHWHHPDLLEDELPSNVRTFQQLSEVLASGDLGRYHADEQPNTHWSNWPEGGRL
jgi:hypothetical protein